MADSTAQAQEIIAEDEHGVVLFTTEPCGFCRGAKELLAKRGVPYREVNLAKNPVGREELARKTGLMTFPQVMANGRSLGGFRDLIALDESGELEAFADNSDRSRLSDPTL